jgi:hypothetical protein
MGRTSVNVCQHWAASRVWHPSKLRSLGFQEDPDIYCRWRFKNLKVDVMATEESVMNFTNRWYGEAMTHSVQVTLPDGKSIRQITAPYFIATKLEAFQDRGNSDYMSHDMEDIVNVIEGRAEIVAEIDSSAESVRLYLRNEFDDLLADPTFVDSPTECIGATTRRAVGCKTAPNRGPLRNSVSFAQTCSRSCARVRSFEFRMRTVSSRPICAGVIPCVRARRRRPRWLGKPQNGRAVRATYRPKI